MDATSLFEELLLKQYSPADTARIVEGSACKRAVTLRANTLLSDRDEVARALDQAGLSWRTAPFYEDAFIVEGVRERAIWDLPAYDQGKVYLQSLSSMIPALVLGACEGEDVLDMCAAPGGKASQIAALGNNGAYVTACEMHAPRADKLEHNLDKLGVRSVTVMRTDARRLDDFFAFDRILLDAPCSGSGTLRLGDGKTERRFTSKLIAKSAKSQRALFDKALALMKPGSTLVYSTCSVLASENEDIVAEGLRRARRLGSFEIEPVELAQRFGADACGQVGGQAESDWPALLPTSLEGALAICPTDLYEGFFVVKIKRSA